MIRKTSASWLACRSGAKPLARRDRGDARGAEVGPEEARSGEPEMRRDQQPIDLFVAVVGEREDRPVRAAATFLGANLDTADDAVEAGRGRHLDAVVLFPVDLDLWRKVEGSSVERNRDTVERPGAGVRQHGRDHGKDQDDYQAGWQVPTLRGRGESRLSICLHGPKQGKCPFRSVGRRGPDHRANGPASVHQCTETCAHSPRAGSRPFREAGWKPDCGGGRPPRFD